MRYRRADGVLSETVEDRAMLVAADGTELLTLNESGTVIWEALGSEGDPAALAVALHAGSGDVALDVVEADVRAFLDELVAASLVVAE